MSLPPIQSRTSRVEDGMNAAASLAVARDPALRLIAETAASFDPVPADEPMSAALSGALLEDEDAVALGERALDDVFSRIAAIERIEAGPADALLAEIKALPAPVRDAAFEALAKGRRWKTAVPGLKTLELPVGGKADTLLIRVEPGAGPPHHDHSGDEYTLILTGAYHDGHRRYQAGELQIAPPGYPHRPLAEPGEICFVLAATYGEGLRFTGLLGFLQRLTGR